jgi:hypothetical protein
MTSEGDARYAAHTAVSRPGSAALEGLPHGLEELVAVVQGLLVHHSRVPGFRPGADATDGTELRPLARILAAIETLDRRPLEAERLPERRLVVDCRSSALLLCAALREQGRPARLRFGFAGYLAPTHWQSHVVVEHLEPGGWTRTDPDLGRFALSPDEFAAAPEAWRSAAADRGRFGYGERLRGRWAVRWELQRDLAALTGFEPLTSDVWGLGGRVPVDSPDGGRRELFDRIAAARSGTERDALATDDALRVPRTIVASPYLTGRSYEVDLVAEGSLDPPGAEPG